MCGHHGLVCDIAELAVVHRKRLKAHAPDGREAEHTDASAPRVETTFRGLVQPVPLQSLALVDATESQQTNEQSAGEAAGDELAPNAIP